jgi:hypothetical protein
MSVHIYDSESTSSARLIPGDSNRENLYFIPPFLVINLIRIFNQLMSWRSTP